MDEENRKSVKKVGSSVSDYLGNERYTAESINKERPVNDEMNPNSQQLIDEP